MRLTCLGRKVGHAARDAVVEARAQGEDEVGLLHGVVGAGRTVHAEHVQRERVELVKGAEALESCGHRDLRLDGELAHLVARPGANDARARVDEGPLRLGDELRGALDRLVRAHGDAVYGLGVHVGLGVWLHLECAGSYVLGQINEHGARAAGHGDLEGLVDAARKLLNGAYEHVPLGAGRGDAHRVALLEGVGANRTCRHLPTEDYHGSPILERVLHGRDEVGGAGPAGDEDHTGPSRHTREALGHVPCALLVAAEHKLEVLALIDGIKDGEDGATRVAKDGGDLVLSHHLMKDDGTRLALVGRTGDCEGHVRLRRFVLVGWLHGLREALDGIGLHLLGREACAPHLLDGG
mmetsp:Transcript_21101/g.51973  ORF Transcript_21101/g.51973 Transcript_21101/m.51973 type:complete len:352 (-) Transcript_21101:159-1214(-)